MDPEALDVRTPQQRRKDHDHGCAKNNIIGHKFLRLRRPIGERATQRIVSWRCPLLAKSGHALVHCKCLLSGVKRTWRFALQTSAYDPKRTSTAKQWFFVNDLAVRTSHDKTLIRCHRFIPREVAGDCSRFVTGGLVVGEFLSLGIAGTGPVKMEKVAWHLITPTNQRRSGCLGVAGQI